MDGHGKGEECREALKERGWRPFRFWHGNTGSPRNLTLIK
jgi:hypothetical protein